MQERWLSVLHLVQLVESFGLLFGLLAPHVASYKISLVKTTEGTLQHLTKARFWHGLRWEPQQRIPAVLQGQFPRCWQVDLQQQLTASLFVCSAYICTQEIHHNTSVCIKNVTHLPLTNCAGNMACDKVTFFHHSFLTRDI